MGINFSFDLKEDSEISSFLFLFGGIIVSGSVRQFGAKYITGGNPVW